ncbi:MAG TPA: hypothetical protein VK986_07180, partial [Tepidisphaeraceae bacterium]|nr:hypothetical protein [Tepidisphaeraceae bacterium]
MARAVRLALAAIVTTGSAGALEWDSVPFNALPDGGSGVWDLTTPNWSLDGGVGNATWDNASQAVFGGPVGGTVQVTGGIQAGALTFNTAGYVLSGLAYPDALTLFSAPTITTNADATIAVPLASTEAVYKLGAEKLTLGGAGTDSFAGLTGAFHASAGSVEVLTQFAAGRGAVYVESGATLING